MKNKVGNYGVKDRKGSVVWDGVSPLPKKYNITKGKSYQLYFDMDNWYICDDSSIYVTDLRHFMYIEDYSVFKFGIRYGDKVVVKDEFRLNYQDVPVNIFNLSRIYYSPNSELRCLMGIFYENSNPKKEYAIPMSNLMSVSKHRNKTIDNILK